MHVVVLVAIDAADQDRLAVDQESSITDLDASEADADGNALAALQRHDERVERGTLRRPLARSAHFDPGGQVAGENGPTPRVDERRLERPVRHTADGETPVAVVVVQRRRHEDVLDAVGAEVHLPRDAGVPPLILVFDEARVRPAHDDGDELVGAAVTNDVGDVEFRRCPGVLRDADGLAVHEHVEHALDTAEAEDDAAPAPAARNGERAGGRSRSGSPRVRAAERRGTASRRSCSAAARTPASSTDRARRPGPSRDAARAAAAAAAGRSTSRNSHSPSSDRRNGDGPARGDRGVRCRIRDERGPRRQSVQALELRRLPARLPAGKQQPVDCGRHALTAAASRSDSAAASGATGLK